MSDVAAVRPHRDRVRVLGALVAVLSLGMAALLFYVGHLSSVATNNRADIDRQQRIITQLAVAVEAEQQDAQAQRQLVRALQRQVRQLGGVPLTEPPPQRSPRGSAADPTGSGSNAGSSPTPSPSRSPRPQPSPSSSPSPRPSHTPSPSPSPSPAASVCVRGVGCVSIGGLLALLASW